MIKCYWFIIISSRDVLRNLTVFDYFGKTLHLKCMAGFWIASYCTWKQPTFRGGGGESHIQQSRKQLSTLMALHIEALNHLICCSWMDIPTRFFYKHKAYKHMNPQNWPKIKHILSICWASFFIKKKGGVCCFQKLCKRWATVNWNALNLLHFRAICVPQQ